MINTRNNVGKFKLGKKAIISDPCYDREIMEKQNGIIEVMPGTWDSKIIVKDGRVYELVAWNVKTGEPSAYSDWEMTNIEVGVDSGQAGIFDLDNYKRNDSVRGLERLYKEDPINPEDIWYSWCCDRTLSEDMSGTIPFGVISSSGYGDGCYTCAVQKTKEEITAISIVFVNDGEDFDERYDREEGEE